MKEIFGPTNKVLEVDVSEKKWSVFEVDSKTRKQYLGGKGLGLKLLHDRMGVGVDPLGPENILAVMPGVLMGTGAPCTGRFAAVAKSPLTGVFTSCSCGGPFGMALKTAGWDGILIKGQADSPMGIEIDKDGVKFIDASEYWGMDTETVQDKLVEKKQGLLAIGPAGENLVRFANIVSGHRFLGRAGLGAVMGSKKIKYIKSVGGEYKIRPVDQKLFDRANKTAKKYIKSNKMTADIYRNYGTAANVNFTTKHNMMPINNFKDGWHEKSLGLSGQAMAEKHQTKAHTCKPCTILCGHKGQFEKKNGLPVPEFETVGCLGSNLGIFDSDLIAEWNQICGTMGMDTISAGGVLGWVMEATEKGLIKSDVTFGDSQAITKALNDIANAEEFGKEMGLGVKALAEKYGGAEFAIHVKGLEMSAYDPRGAWGQGLGYAVANRGACHLSSYPVALEALFELINPHKTRSKAEFTKFLENLYCCINSLHTCQFTAFAYIFESPLTKYTPDFMLGMLMQNLSFVAIALIDFSTYKNFWQSTTGIKISRGEFLTAGERIHVLERYMNTREGISRKDDTLPARMLKEGRESDKKQLTVPLEGMLDRYYKLRGFDNDGIPEAALLNKLQIEAQPQQ